jgi:hypothetical protein
MKHVSIMMGSFSLPLMGCLGLLLPPCIYIYEPSLAIERQVESLVLYILFAFLLSYENSLLPG